MSKKPLFFYGWIILALSFIAMSLCMGARNSFSVFYVEILDEFGWSRSITAGIFSVNVLVYGVAAPLVGALVDKFGPKRVLLAGGAILTLAIIFCSRANSVYHFYLLFGVAVGIGTSLIGYPTNATVLPHWFVRKRGMAFGILTSGWGMSFFMIPLVDYLIRQFGWRTSFILLGVLVGVILLPLVALLSRDRPQDMGLLPDGILPSENPKSTLDEQKSGAEVNEKLTSINWTLRKAMGAHQFWLMFGAFFCFFGLVENLVVVHQVALMRDTGLSSTFAVSIVALWGAMVVAGNLSGFLSDRIGREQAATLGCGALVLGLVMLLILERKFYGWIPYVYAVFCGLGMGMNSSVLGAAAADIFHGKTFGTINGFMTLGFGLGGIVGPWFGGVVFDTTGSYSGALIAAVLVACIALTFLWVAAPRKTRKIGWKEDLL